MNAVGKTNFGRKLAAKLGLRCIDTDAAFRKLHGKEAEYIARHGWGQFREAEAKIVLSSLLPGKVVVVAGGAVEAPAVRTALKAKAAVIWIQAHPKKVGRHIRAAKRPRPEFAGGVPEEVAKKLLEERTPHYEEIADIRIHPGVPFQQFLPIAIAELLKFHARATTPSEQ